MALAILSIYAAAQTLIYVKLDPLTGRVVRFNKSLMDASSEGDLIVRVAKQNRFVRLIYCASNCGIDIPQHAAALPEQMIKRSDLVWTFGVHAPETPWERTTCGAIPKILKEGKRPMEVVVSKGNPFVSTPRQAQVPIPKLDSIRCYVIGNWSLARKSTAN